MDWGSHHQPKKKEVDWDSFETKGGEIEDEIVIRNPLLAGIFHGFMIFCGLSLLFAVGGGVLWFLLNGPRSFAFTRAKSVAVGWGQFGFGGLMVIAWVMKMYFKRCRWE